MYQPTLTTSKELMQYDSSAYTAFIGKLRANDADWNVFLPNTANSDVSSILFKYKRVGAENFEHTYIPNPFLYTLKNEFNCGYCHGFALTDLFSTFLDIADKFFADGQLRVYKKTFSPEKEETRVFEFTEKEEGDLKTFAKNLKAIGNEFSRTDKIIKKWIEVVKGRDLQNVMHRFSLYVNALLEEEIQTNNISDTPYHWYGQLKKCSSFSQVIEFLAVYNINFEKLISDSEQFFVAINRQKGLRANNGGANKLQRPIYID